MNISVKLVSFSYRMLIPLFVTIELTKRCINNCLFCYLDTKSDYELNLDELKNILDDLKNLGAMFITFTGGEPLIRDDIVDIIKLSKEKGFCFKLFSSLSFECKEKLTEMYKYGLFDIEVSLHGFRDTHNYVTGRDCFDITVKNIIFARKIGYRVVIKTPITNININELIWIKKFADENGIIVRFDPIITSSEKGNKKNTEFQIDADNFKGLISRGIFELESSFVESSKEYFSCGALRNVVAIRSNGDIIPCLAFSYVVGNIRRNRISDIWFSDVVELLRQDLSKAPQECYKCDMIDLCARCPGIAYIEAGDYCSIYNSACFISKVVKKYLEEVKNGRGV